MSAPPRPDVSFSASQRWSIRFQVALGLVSLAALVVMVNYLSLHYFKRLDLSGDPASRLSPQTEAVLRSLTNEVRVTIFFDPIHRPDLYSLTTRLLKEYKSVNPSRLTLHSLNYALFDGEAKDFLFKHHLSALSDKDFVFFESGSQSQIVYATDLAEININEMLRGEATEFKRSKFKGEMLFSAALVSVTYPQPLKAYFLRGHGEHNPEEATADTGYSKFAGMLKQECNTASATLLLRGTNAIPADCQLLIEAGPQTSAFSSDELKRIQDYLTRGGRLLVLLNNRTMGESSGIEELLSLWGVGVTNVPFDDNDASISGHSQELLVSIYSDGQSFHPIVSPLIINESAIKLFAPRVVLRQRLDSKGADAPKVEWIAFSSTNSVDAQGRRGSRPLAVTVEQGNIRGVTLDRGNTRIVVIGDSLCFDNLNYGAVANSYFAYNTASWLLNRPPILLKGLGPRRLKEYKLVLTAGQFRRVCWVLLAGLPGTVLLIGGLVSFSRRR